MAVESAAWLWFGVLAIGAFHGLNPAMGWPLALANGLTEKRAAAVFAAFVPLGLGHLLAMATVLVPFALLSWLLAWQREIRIVAGVLILLFGLGLLRRRSHPRWLARVPPGRLLLWSFLMATAHGAALMLLPIVLQLCQVAAAPASVFEHEAMMVLMRRSTGTAVLVSLLHTAAMIGVGLAVAWAVYRYLGLRALRSAWFNLDRIWALCLVAAGAAALAMALAAAPHAGG